jgi:hypothetical protein
MEEQKSPISALPFHKHHVKKRFILTKKGRLYLLGHYIDNYPLIMFQFLNGSGKG